MVFAAVDGRKGGGHLANWKTLISQIKKTVDFSESLVEEMFGKQITFTENANVDLLKKNLPDMLSILKSKGKLSKFDILLHSEFKIVAASASINGKNPESYSDYALINNQLILQDMRKECAVYWNQLMASHGVASFETLHATSPETVAVKMIPEIEKYLNWYHDAYPLFVDSLCNLGISKVTVFCVDALKTDVEEMQQILFAVDNMLPLLVTVIQCYLRNREIECYLCKILFTKIAT